MKRIGLYFAALVSIMMLDACKEKEQPKDTAEYADYYEIPKPGEPIDLSQPASETVVKWRGESCVVKISSQAADSLPMVVNEFGQKYKDNVFNLKILKGDGNTVLYQHSLKKTMFLSKIKDNALRPVYEKQSILKSVTAKVDENRNFQYFYVCLQDPEAVEDDNILFKFFTDGTIEQEELDYMHDSQETVYDE